MSGCIHFCLLLRQAQDKRKWNNLPLSGFNSLFSNAAFTNMYPISLFWYILQTRNKGNAFVESSVTGTNSLPLFRRVICINTDNYFLSTPYLPSNSFNIWSYLVCWLCCSNWFKTLSFTSSKLFNTS